MAENKTARCGGFTVRSRLCEGGIVLAIRRAIAIGTVDAGLLAGLAHPKLHMSLVAMHDKPARSWNISGLSAIAGMSCAQFIEIFKKTVEKPPGAYLTHWRLALGKAKLQSGYSVKSAAAFSRKFGHSPGESKAREA